MLSLRANGLKYVDGLWINNEVGMAGTHRQTNMKLIF